MGIKWVFLIELPDTGTFGFLLPATKIKGVGHSVFEGIRALAVTISRKLYWKNTKQKSWLSCNCFQKTPHYTQYNNYDLLSCLKRLNISKWYHI